MFNWFKPKKSVAPATSAQKPQSREEIVAAAMQNARDAREAIGEETLAKLSALLQKKQMQDTTSPASQAKKIIQQMDKDKVSDFLKFVIREDQTKH
jgi:uncharacterized alpha-E superfamily protein